MDVNFNWLIKFGIIKIDESESKIQESQKNLWVPNNAVTNCFECENKFTTIMVRQHHCRICGNIFCSNCSNKQIQVSNNNKIIKLRVCNNCFIICQDFSKYIDKKMIKGELKEQYYCKLYENSKEINKKFANFGNVENENKIKDNINNIYELILKNLVKNVLNEYLSKELAKEWENTLFLLVKDVIYNLRTSSLFLNDYLDINEYIKIKIIPYKDNSMCKVISGFVVRNKNNIISKNIKSSFIGPKILLVNLEKDFISKKLDDFSNMFQRSESYIKIIENKFRMLDPDIVVVGIKYPKLLLNNLKNNSSLNNKCIIFGMKEKSFKSIARCTHNIILNSFDLIGTDNILGKCKHFYTKKIKESFKKQNEDNNIKQINNKFQNYFEEEGEEEEYELIVFEGSNPLLFNTILLSGEDKIFLKKIKNILRNILLPTARDLFLQKYLLYTFNMNVGEISQEKIKEEEEQIYSKFEENKNYRPKELDQEQVTINDFELIKNSFKITKNSYENVKDNKVRSGSYDKEKKITKKESKEISKYENNNLNYNSFYRGFDLEIICKKSEYINYSLIQISKTKINNVIDFNKIEDDNLVDLNENEINHSLTCSRIGSFISVKSDTNITEKSLHKIVAKYCRPPFKVFYSFFSDRKPYDKSFGKFILQICKASETNCPLCGISLSKHVFHYYKSNERIIIKLLSESEYDLQKILNNIKNNNIVQEQKDDTLLDIYTYGYCNICQRITTPLFKLPYEILNYSKAKIFRIILENTSLENICREYNYNIANITFNNNECKHYINKNISRIFVTNLGSWVFEYSDISKYFISPLKINNHLNNIEKDNKNLNNYIELIEQYMNEGNKNSNIILDMLYNLFSKQKSDLEIALNDEKMYLFRNSINLLINIIVMGMKMIEKFKNILPKILNKENVKPENNFLLCVSIIKKVYLKIIKIKIIANTIDKSINEIKIISDILNNQMPYSYEENIKILEGKHKDIPIELQLSDIQVDKSPKVNINFENNLVYIKMISFIEYYDDKHNKYSTEYVNHDLSCIISLALSSDDYLNFIKTNNFNNIQFENIKCERSPEELDYEGIKKYISSKKNNVIYLNMFKKKEDNKNDEMSFEEQELKEKMQQNNKTNFNSSLVFNIGNNKFIDIKNENNDNNKILTFLENELISNKKDEFNFTLSNNYYEIFDIKEKNNKDSIDEKEKEKEKEKNIIDKIDKEINIIKNQLVEFNNSFIDQQRELNSIIKSLIRLRDNKKSSIRKSRRKSSSSIKNNIDEYNNIMESKTYQDESNLSNLMNENDDRIQEATILPYFPFVPEFLKIFDLKKEKYYEEELLERKYLEYKIKVYFPNQFEALRTVFCATNEEFLKAIRKSFEWSVSGGKSKANFFKTIDSKYVVKSISEMEFNMYIELALNYFKHISKFLFHGMPSAMAKILGAYSIKIKYPGGKENNYYMIYMENIYYGMITSIDNYTFNAPEESNIMVYDLKGSKINRFVQKKDKKPGKVLLDTNFLEDFNGEPLFFEFNVFQILQNALNNDSQFLKEEGVIDYSLLIILEYENYNKNDKKENEKNFKIIRLGIIDYLRKYTWDKQIESYSKKFIHGFTNPTIIDPDSYSKRFMKKIKRYFVGI